MSFPIEWRLPRPFLWIALFFAVVIPAFTVSWFMFKFSIPFIHAGDKAIVVIPLAVCWWLAATLLIFGWRGKR